MNATPTARQMDSIYRHQRYIYDLTRRYYLLGRDEMIEALAPPRGSRVLEIGCGTARNLLRVAGRYPGVSLYGIDISSEMLKTAEKSVAKSRHARQIALAAADATDFDPEKLFGVAAFDRIFISYSLSMIPSYDDVIDSAISHLSPDGAVHIVDFGGMNGLPGMARWAMLGWLAKFSVTPRRDLSATVGRIAAIHGRSAHVRESRFGYAVHATVT